MRELRDFGRTGKEKPWKRHKLESQQISETLIRIGRFNQADKMLDCAGYLDFRACPSGHERVLKRANFCRGRFCPTCSWRRALKVFGQVLDIASLASQQYKIRWLFLTVTVRNVPGKDLSETIDQMMQGFNRLNQRAFFKKYCYGWFRAMEVTRQNALFDRKGNDNEWYGTYHPHYHVLLAMKPSYFKDGYLKQSEWAELWADSVRVDYQPIVDIRRVTNKADKEREKRILLEKGVSREYDGTLTDLPATAVAEVSKYTLKSKELLYDYDPISGVAVELDEDQKADIMFDLFPALNHRRLYAFGGLLKRLHRELHLQDVESSGADLNDLRLHEQECKCSVCQSSMVEEIYSWLPSRLGYYQVKKESTAVGGST